MMGGKGVTVGERNRLLPRTVGVMAGSDAKGHHPTSASSTAR